MVSENALESLILKFSFLFSRRFFHVCQGKLTNKLKNVRDKAQRIELLNLRLFVVSVLVACANVVFSNVHLNIKNLSISCSVNFVTSTNLELLGSYILIFILILCCHG